MVHTCVISLVARCTNSNCSAHTHMSSHAQLHPPARARIPTHTSTHH